MSDSDDRNRYSSRDDQDNDRSGGYGRSSDKGGYKGSKSRSYFKKKVCRFCTQNYQMDYKKPETLQRFLTDRGKILPRRITGTCAKHQRRLATVIKRARAIALLPFVKQ